MDLKSVAKGEMTFFTSQLEALWEKYSANVNVRRLSYTTKRNVACRVCKTANAASLKSGMIACTNTVPNDIVLRRFDSAHVLFES